MAKKAIIVLNGNLQKNVSDYKKIIKKGRVFIAADGGSNLFYNLNSIPDIIIGDMDSILEEKIEFFKNQGVEIIKYPSQKDETDGELALLYCFNNDIKDIIITNTLGGRLDHQFANIFLLEYALELGLKAVIKEPELEIGIIDNKKQFNNYRGNILSIIPLSETVANITNTGFKYPLNREKLMRYKTRGISNIITDNSAAITLDKGKLIYIVETKKE